MEGKFWRRIRSVLATANFVNDKIYSTYDPGECVAAIGNRHSKAVYRIIKPENKWYIEVSIRQHFHSITFDKQHRALIEFEKRALGLIASDGGSPVKTHYNGYAIVDSRQPLKKGYIVEANQNISTVFDISVPLKASERREGWGIDNRNGITRLGPILPFKQLEGGLKNDIDRVRTSILL